MPTRFQLALLSILLLPIERDVAVQALVEPRKGEDLLIAVELSGEDAAQLWDVEDVELESVETSAGERLEPILHRTVFVEPGDRDPRRKDSTKLGEGQKLVVFRFREPPQEVASIPRLAGRYRALSGGREEWVEVPYEELSKPKTWRDKLLKAADLKLKHSVRGVPQIEVRFQCKPGTVRWLYLSGSGSDDARRASGTVQRDGVFVHTWDVPLDDRKKAYTKVDLRFELGGKTEIELDGLRLESGPSRVEDARLQEAGISVELALTEAREVHAEGSGDTDMLRGFRWVDADGKPLEVSSRGGHGGSTGTVMMWKRIPDDIADGSRLQFGVLLDARWETRDFEYEEIAGPAR